MKTKQILDRLDKHATEFNFPVLDNAYVQFAAARLSAFRDTADWLIVFEVLGFSSREVEFVLDIYAYGSCVPKEGLVGQEIPFTSAREESLFDEMNECIADWSRWSIILVGDEKLTFAPSPEEYAAAGIIIKSPPGPRTLTEIDLLRFVVHRLGANRLFMSDQQLLSHFPPCVHLPKFVQTTEWHHPDIAAEERPSESVSIRTLINALAERNPLLFERGQRNTDWKCWS